MRLPRLCLLVGPVLIVALSRAASFDDRVEALFRPPLGELMALTPDGQRVAYTSQTGRDLSIVIMSLEPPGQKRTVSAEPERDPALPALADNRPPTRLRFLRWATAGRLVFAPTERIVPLPPVTDTNGRSVPNPDGPTIVSPILMVDLEGKQRGTLVDAHQFQETPADARKSLADFLRTTKELVATRNEPVRWKMPHLDVLGFLPRERDQLIIQTRGGYSPPAQHLVDIRTGSVREFGNDWPVPPGEPQVFDGYRLKVVGERKDAARPTTRWQDAELGKVQRELEVKFPRRVVEILDWSETRARVLFRVVGGSDAGRIFVYQRPEDLVLEIGQRAPWLSAAKLNETRFFEVASADGALLSGYITWPSKPRLTPPPVVVGFPSGFPGQVQPAFDPEAQVFADLGFVVVRLNHRCVAGVRPEDLGPLRAAADRVAVDDARAAIDGLAASNPNRAFDRKRIAALGRGFGGYLALRALQLEPDVFRSGIAIDAPTDLRAWLQAMTGGDVPAPAQAARAIPAGLIDHATADWKKLSVVEHAEALKNPALLLIEPGRNATIDRAAAELRGQLQALGRAPDFLELDPGFAEGRPTARAGVYRKIDEFLTAHGQGYSVKIGPTKEVK